MTIAEPGELASARHENARSIWGLPDERAKRPEPETRHRRAKAKQQKKRRVNMIKFYCSELAATWKLLLILRALRLKFARLLLAFRNSIWYSFLFWAQDSQRNETVKRTERQTTLLMLLGRGWWRWTSTESDDHDERWWLLGLKSTNNLCIISRFILFFTAPMLGNVCV